MNRVKQISLDVLVSPEVDGEELAQRIADELEKCGLIVLGAGFQDDLTDVYKEHFPKMLETVWEAKI